VTIEKKGLPEWQAFLLFHRSCAAQPDHFPADVTFRMACLLM
jgi:hypothetical protein